VTEGWLIIGYGSRLRGDDAVGLHAARLLARRGFRTLAVPQLTPELAESIALARTVVFVDADARLAPGEVAMAPVEAAPLRSAAARRAPMMEHHATPESLLRLVRELYTATPQAWRAGIGGADFGLGGRLSPAAKTGLRRAVAEVLARANEASPPIGPAPRRLR